MDAFDVPSPPAAAVAAADSPLTDIASDEEDELPLSSLKRKRPIVESEEEEEDAGDTPQPSGSNTQLDTLIAAGEEARLMAVSCYEILIDAQSLYSEALADLRMKNFRIRQEKARFNTEKQLKQLRSLFI